MRHLALVLTLAACSSQTAASNGDSIGPRLIDGGNFEASGATSVPNSNLVLFVDDGRRNELRLLELTSDGRQRRPATRIALDANVTDLEGMTTDGQHYYVVGSQSKGSGYEGDGLVRFTFDSASRATGNVERIRGLKAWLAEAVPELRGTANRIGDEVLNIEGLAWDPVNERLLLGLRAPVVDDHALIVPLKFSGAFTRENLRLDGSSIRLNLGGAGLRGMEYDAQTRSFRLIAGAPLNAESRDFQILEWDGQPGSTPRSVGSHSRRLKPEGITRVYLDGRPATVIVFDTGAFAVTQ